MTTILRVIDATTIERLAPPPDLIGWMRDAMLATSRREVTLPLRRGMALPEGAGFLGIMPGHVAPLDSAGVKLISLVPPDRRRGSSHLGLCVLYDADGLVPVAILCGATLTALRTAAATALATDVLARQDADELAILGAGEQARSHLRALASVRAWRSCRIWARDPAAAERLIDERPVPWPLTRVDSVAAAVSGADVVCAVTAATTPILRAADLSPGTHLNLVGSSHADALEADPDIVPVARYFVDFWPSALDQASELLAAVERGLVTPSHVQAEIGEVLAGSRPGRTYRSQITLYKSLGIAAQDIVTARRVYERAVVAGLGQVVSL